MAGLSQPSTSLIGQRRDVVDARHRPGMTNACALLRSDLIEACVAYKDAVRSLNNPDVVGNRRHLVVGIAEDIILGTLARVSPITDSVDFVDVVAHAFFSEPTTTPARRSIILTIAVKSASPPNSELVVSH